MPNKEGGEFYHSLSRKDLQSMCKKYGLPARKTNSEMAESLYSYFQKKNLSLAISSKNMGGIQEVLTPPISIKPLQVQMPSSFTGQAIKDGCRLRSYPREVSNEGNYEVFFGGSQSQVFSQCAENGTVHNLHCSGRIEDTPLCQYISSYAKVTPSFEFHASSEEGINLCVDLSSSPLEWIKECKNQVSFCKNVDIAKSKSLHQELGCTDENNKQTNKSSPHTGDFEQVSDGFVEAKSSSSSDIKEDNEGNDHHEGTDKPFLPLASRSCSEVLVDDSGCLREDQGPISSNPNSNVQVDMKCNRKLCDKHGSSATTLGSGITDVPTENTACNFAFNSTSDGSVNIVAVENPSSTYDDEIHENSILWKNGNLENNCGVPRFLTSSAEMQLSETENYRKGKSSPANKSNQEDSKHNVVAEQAKLTTSSGNDHSESHMAEFTVDQEGSDVSFGRESSVCSQVENSIGNPEFERELPKKRPAIDNGVQNDYSKTDTKVLRSMKQSSGDSYPRRSMRLVSK